MHKFICRLNASENHCGIIKYKMYYNMQPIPGVETLLQLLSLQWSIICNYIFSSVYVIFFVRIIESVIKEWLIYQQHTQIALRARVCVCVPAACAAACEVPLREVKQVLQSLLALMMSSPGANKSTQRPKLVPPAPCDMSWSIELTAPTVMTYTHTHTHTWKEVKVRVACRWARMWLHFQC